MSESASCCRCCVSFIFTLGLTALILWLNLRPSKPSFSIKNFYVPALNTTATAATNTNTKNKTISIEFKIQNTNKDKGVYYDALNITLYYALNLSFPVGNSSIPGFYQGHKKTATKWATVQQVEIPWEEAVRNVSSNGRVLFRVDLATAVRYRFVGWKTGRHKIRFHADEEVDKQGSAAPDQSFHRPYFSGVLAFFFFVFLTVW